jgi:FSR family fosmidomycin resistance protein-like MFS transporter
LNANPIRLILPIALAHLTIELCNNYMPVVYPILIPTMGLSYAQVGLVTLVASIGATLVQPLFGFLSDRWKPRRIVVASIIWIGLLMGLVGLTRNYWLLILLVGLGSLGSAAFHPAGATAAGSITTTRRGATLSIFSVTGSLGTALSPLLITVGLAWLGLSATVLLIPIGLVVGLLLLRQSGWGGNAKAGSAHAGPGTTGGQAAVRAGSLVALILVILMVMCRSWVQVSLITYLPEWLQDQGWTPARSSQMLTVLLVSITVGTLIGGTASDRIGRWPVLLIGVLIGSSFPVTVVMAQDSWPHGVGLASALVMGLGWLPGGIGASTTGLIADGSSLTTALLWLVIAPVLGLSFALMYALVWTRHSERIPEVSKKPA